MAHDYKSDERVITAFLVNFRVTDIIKESKLSKSTVYRLRNDPDFMAVIQERKEAILAAAVGKMKNSLVNDATILQEIIDDPETAKQVKINAIQLKWNQLREWETTLDILKRLEALEKTTGNKNQTV